jgi:hypothetical protein
MSFRNLSPQVMFEKMALEHVPVFRFKGRTRRDFLAWQKAARSSVLATLGDFPRRVPLDPLFVAEWEHDGLRKQRWLINVGPHIAAEFLVNFPAGLKKGEKRPAILCCHGHGPFGKEPVMGNDSSPELKGQIDQLGYNYGHAMAKHGFITYSIDWIGFGERNDNNKPNFRNQNAGRDWCNLYYLHATMLGMTSLSINIAHGQAATDFAVSLPFVDGKRLGVMGLSGGGTMTVWMAMCDKRFRAAEIICYSDLWAYFGIRDTNYCGMQVAPGLYKLVDLPELQGLLAPLPLLVDIGANDTCFRVDTAMTCYRQVEKIYKAAGASERLLLDFHSGEHKWAGNRSEIFFKKHLWGTK